MFYHFCFVLLLAAGTSYGQFLPRNNLLPNPSRPIEKPLVPNNPGSDLGYNGNDNRINDLDGSRRGPIGPSDGPNGPALAGVNINIGNEGGRGFNPNDESFGRGPLDRGNGADAEMPTTSNPSLVGVNINLGNRPGSIYERPIDSRPNDSAYGRLPIDGGDNGAVTELFPTSDPNGSEFEPIDGGSSGATDPNEPIRFDPNDPGYGREPIDNRPGTELPPISEPNELLPVDGGNEPTSTSVNPSYTTTEGVSIDFGGSDGTELPSSLGPHDLITESVTDKSNDTGVEPSREQTCLKRYAYYRIDGQCDSYIECRNFRPVQRLCPDGMHFRVNTRWSEYPCGYPQDVPCIGRGPVQPPQPTKECPHQFGFFPINDPSASSEEKCSRYLMCSAGVAVLMDCPFGLAFDAESGQCNWPANVPACRDFLGFHCPALPDGTFDDRVRNFEYNRGECRFFWSCVGGEARVLSCDVGLAFDPNTGRCVDEDLVQCNHYDDNSLEPESATRNYY